MNHLNQPLIFSGDDSFVLFGQSIPKLDPKTFSVFGL